MSLIKVEVQIQVYCLRLELGEVGEKHHHEFVSIHNRQQNHVPKTRMNN